MIERGDVYFYSDPSIPPHPIVVVSREELNRGDRVVAAIIASRKFAVRLPNGPIGRLDDPTMREVIKAVGYVMDSDCEPT